MKGILVSVLAASAAIAIAAPVFADQGAQPQIVAVVAGNSASRIVRDRTDVLAVAPSVVAGNSASRIVREPAAVADVPSMAQTQVVAGNSVSRIVREPATVADVPSAPQAQAVLGNSAARVVRAPSDNVADAATPQPHTIAITAASPAATPQPQQAAVQPQPQPTWVEQLLDQTAAETQQQYTGPVIPGNTVSRIEGFSAIPETCADCSSKPWLTQSRMCRYGAQILDAIAVAAAVRGGKQERIGFGNRPNPLAYMVALGAEDYIADNVVGATNPHVQMAVNYTMCGASLFNAIKSATAH